MTYSETDPSVNSVYLIGSWDNFTNQYAMERDSRRGGGQWKGCPTFQTTTDAGHANPACKTDARADNGVYSWKSPAGLHMGQTYYYYVSR